MPQIFANQRRFCTLLLALLLPLAARANPFELFGFTPRGIGLGGAMVGLSDDLAGSFYNPAGIIGHTKSEFGIGFANSIPSLHVNRGKAGGTAPTPSDAAAAPRCE